VSARVARALGLAAALAAALPAGPGASPAEPGPAAGGAPRATEADRRLLAGILARPEYRRDVADAAALRRALAGLWARVLDLLGTAEAERWASTGRAVFLAAAAAAAALGVAALRRRVRARRGGGAAAADEAAERGGPSATASAEDAEAALRAGEPREAVRRALLAALAALERTGRLPGGRAMTNAEIAREVDGATSTSTSTATSTATPTPTPTSTSTPTATATATATGALTFLAALFDRTFYGGLPVTLDDAEAAVRAARAVGAAEGGG